MDGRWRIELLGWLRAIQGDRVVSRFRSQKTGALFAYLAYHCHRSHPREVLIELLWPEGDLEAGRNGLRVALTSLRHQLEPPGVPAGAVLMADRTTVQLNPAACSTDTAEFEAACQAALPTGRLSERGIEVVRAPIDRTERVQRLEEAAALYRGELLPGYYEEWVLPARQRLAEMYQQVLEQLIDLLEGAGDPTRALPYARRAVEADPLREPAQYAVIRMLAAAGHADAALHQYRELERLLARELGATPAPEIRDFVRAIGRPAGGVQDPSGGVGVGVGVGVGRGSPTPTPTPTPTPRAAFTLNSEPVRPHGTVTFLLTDIEGSTLLRNQTGEAFGAALSSYRSLLRRLVKEHGGYPIQPGPSVDESGEDAFVVAFERARDGLACAIECQRALAAHPWPQGVGPIPVRMALHTGDVEAREGEYQGPARLCALRILLAGHGGQILCSEETAGLLRHDPSEEVNLVDLGVYRLRGVAAPERLFLVEYPGMARREFPPLNAAPAQTGHLPAPFDRFFGREEEIAHLLELLRPGSCRLVTLTGPGGSGKTRLALEVAQRLRDALPGAAWLVSLADLADAGLIVEKIREAMRLPHPSPLEPLDQIVSSLTRQPSLLLLDNFEHLVAEGAPLVVELLARAPTLRLLITSRQRLGVDGEQEVPVAPLPTPPPAPPPAPSLKGEGGLIQPEVLLEYPSVRLFVDRAQAARPDFQVTARNAGAVAAVCARLEGLPLAIELAAARARMLTPQQMLERLAGSSEASRSSGKQGDGRFDLLVSRRRDPVGHHRSLKAALDWSYQLLSPELRWFFAQLSVFRGGFALEAAERIGEAGDRTLEYLEQLRDHSLILTAEGGEGMRYRLLETVREYAAGQLPEGQQQELAKRHAANYCALAEQAEPQLVGAGQALWLERLEQEHDNLRAALTWSEESGEVETGLRLAGALWEFWATRGHLAEGRERLARLLEAEGAVSSPPSRESGVKAAKRRNGARPAADGLKAARAKALACAGVLADFQGEYAAAHAFHEEGLALRRELNDQWGIAFSLTAMGFVAQHQGDFAAARVSQEEGLSIWRALDNRSGIAWSLNSLADVVWHQGDHRTARRLFEESLAIRREIGDDWGAAFALSGLGTMALQEGDLEAARTFHEQSLALRRALGDKRGVATSVTNLGHVARRRGDLEEARALLGEGLAIQQELGDQGAVADSLYGLGKVASSRGDRGMARSLIQESLALAVELGGKEGIAACLEALAAVDAVEGRPLLERAARLCGAAGALRQAIGAPLPPSDLAEHERLVAELRDRLGETRFVAAWEAGRGPETDGWRRVVDEALGVKKPDSS